MAGGQVRGGRSRGPFSITLPPPLTHDVFFSNVRVTSMNPLKADIRAGRKHPQRTNFILSSCISCFFLSKQFDIVLKSRLWHLLLAFSGQASALCFADRHSWTLLVQCHRLADCDGSTQQKESLCVHTTFLHGAHQTLRGFAVTEDVHHSQVLSPSTNTCSMYRRNIIMRSGQVTTILLRRISTFVCALSQYLFS